MQTAEAIIANKGNDIVAVSKNQTLFEAIQLMNEKKIGAILVEEGDDMIGIWTERDFLRKSSDPDFKPQSVKIGDSMSSPLHFANHDATLTQLEEMFLGLFVRHLPVRKEGRFIGMVSIGELKKWCPSISSIRKRIMLSSP